MRRIAKILIALTILTFMLYIAIFGIGLNFIRNFDDKKTADKELIGEHFVIKGDTLMIIDFNWIDNTYSVAENDKTYAKEFVQKNLINK